SSSAPSVTGQWARHETIPGNFFGMSLVSQGSAISGTGSFQGEAGIGGTSTVTGSITGNTVNLDFALVSQLPDGPLTSTEHFTGTLLFGRLLGTMQFDPASSPAASVEFERTN
ncbi:MAG TPA: hypothetical protein VK511_02280, partial [Gemmatimonadaceae bacterium]|nr:hypothetical protein [Gemmatimonadaceae bacterium]